MVPFKNFKINDYKTLLIPVSENRSFAYRGKEPAALFRVSPSHTEISWAKDFSKFEQRENKVITKIFTPDKEVMEARQREQVRELTGSDMTLDDYYKLKSVSENVVFNEQMKAKNNQRGLNHESKVKNRTCKF